MARDVIFSANNNEEVMILPVVPEIDLKNPQNNETFVTVNSGTLNLIGGIGLKTFSITSKFPGQNYPWIRPGSVGEPSKYVDFFEKWRDRKLPFRCITSKKDGSEWFNMACLVDDFDYVERKNGDVDYTLELSEYPFIEGK